mmetsp:Transcript_11964/g.22974  ORF Transcript_11964/g.22974 Transcript_11964/m.22974 type:complete len:137 (-) Transcript_11964:709-1119(-)
MISRASRLGFHDERCMLAKFESGCPVSIVCRLRLQSNPEKAATARRNCLSTSGGNDRSFLKFFRVSNLSSLQQNNAKLRSAVSFSYWLWIQGDASRTITDGPELAGSHRLHPLLLSPHLFATLSKLLFSSLWGGKL